MKFNGIKKKYLTVLRGRNRPPWAELERNLIQVPGMPGAYVSGTNVQVRRISVPVLIQADSFPELQKIKEDMADWLVTDEPKELIFNDEPDRTYYAMVSGTLDLEELVRWGEGIIEFICPDPYKYGQELTQEFTQDSAIVENPGTAETEPIIELEVMEDTTFAMISNGDDYVMIGRPPDVGEAPTDPRPIVLEDPASSLVPWTNMVGGFNFFNLGLVGGQMGVYGGYAFEPLTYGTNPNGWTGPAIRRSLSEPLQDFEIEIDIAMINYMTGVGRIFVAGLDADDEPVFVMGMTDPSNSRPNNQVFYYLGDKQWFRYVGDEGKHAWNNGRFLLRISRQGQEFRARIARKLDPLGREQTGRHHREYTDTLGEHQKPVTQIAIYMARAANFQNVIMYFHHLWVRKLVNLSDYEVPIIAHKDDLIIFDHREAEVYINGQLVSELFDNALDFGSEFFSLHKGYNTITALPENAFDTKIRFKPRYR